MCAIQVRQDSQDCYTIKKRYSTIPSKCNTLTISAISLQDSRHNTIPRPPVMLRTL